MFALAAIGVPAAAALAQDEASDAPPTFSVVAPDQSALGVSYPEWVSRWNQWFLGLPADGHPMMVDDCQAGQQGDAFIVPTTYFGNTLQTTCTVASPMSTSWSVLAASLAVGIPEITTRHSSPAPRTRGRNSPTSA